MVGWSDLGGHHCLAVVNSLAIKKLEADARDVGLPLVGIVPLLEKLGAGSILIRVFNVNALAQCFWPLGSSDEQLRKRVIKQKQFWMSDCGVILVYHERWHFPT